MYATTTRFVASAERTTGTVIALDERTSTRTDADGGTRRSTAWAPVVRFVASDGRTVEFRSNVATSPPAHDVGDTVTAAYDPSDPTDARIVGFTDLYLIPLIFGGIGLVFAGIGALLLFLRIRRPRQREWLRQHGQPVEAEVTDVRVDNQLPGQRPAPERR